MVDCEKNGKFAGELSSIMKGFGRIGNVIHWVIMSLSGYAVGCCGFHILPVWGYSENYESINMTWLSIALSYIAGYVIYLFTSAWPRKQREDEVFELWKPHLSKLYNEMSERIEEVRVFSDIPKERIKDLAEEDCKGLKHYTATFPLIHLYKEIERGGSEGVLRIQGTFHIKNDLNRHYDEMVHRLDVMLSNPMAMDASRKILDILTQIKTSRFLQECTRITDNSQLKANITTAELPKAYMEYVELWEELSKLSIKKYSFEIRKMTDEEIKKSEESTKEQLAKMGLTKETWQVISQELTDASRKK